KYLSRMDGPHLLDEDRRMFLGDGAAHAIWVESVAENFWKGSTAFSEDMIILTRPWRFKLQDIRIPVYLWHGEADAFAPVQMARYLAQSIPVCDAVFYPNEGHALFFNRWDEILAQVLTEFDRQYS